MTALSAMRDATPADQRTYWHSAGDILEHRVDAPRLISEATARDLHMQFVRIAADCAAAELRDLETYFLRREADLREALFRRSQWGRAAQPDLRRVA